MGVLGGVFNLGPPSFLPASRTPCALLPGPGWWRRQRLPQRPLPRVCSVCGVDLLPSPLSACVLTHTGTQARRRQPVAHLHRQWSDLTIELLGRPRAPPGWFLTLRSQGVLFAFLCHGWGGGTGDTKHSPHLPS